MVHSELVAILRSFSQKEQRGLEQFLLSPYFAKGKDLADELKLASHVFAALAPGKPSENLLEPDRVFAVLYPGRAFNAPALNNLIGSLLKMVRQFIETEMLLGETRPIAKRTLQVNFFLQKEAFDLCQKYLKRLEEERKANCAQDEHDFLADWQAEEAKTIFLGLQSELTGDFNLKGSLRALEDFYLIRRLTTLTTLFNLNHLTPILSFEERENFIQDIDAWRGAAIFQHPVVQLSRMVLQIFHYEGKQAEAIFQAYMDLLARHEKELSLYYLERLESFAYNFCARRFQQDVYKKFLFELFKRRTHPDRLDRVSSFQANEFLSLVKLGILLKQFEWVAGFLERYRTGIVGIQPSEVYYQFNLALYYFATGRYDAARDIVIRQDNFHESHYKYFSKALGIKCFYETEKPGDTLVDGKLQTLKVMLSRESKMTPDKVKRYKNFVNLLLQINRQRQNAKPDAIRLQKIGDSLQDKKNTAEWGWLLEKLKELGWAPPGAEQEPGSTDLIKD